MSDSEVTVKGIHAGEREGPNADLWVVLWNLVAKRGITLTARWVKSHVVNEPWLIDRYPTTLRDVFGNACADKLAERAAAVVMLTVTYCPCVRRC